MKAAVLRDLLRGDLAEIYRALRSEPGRPNSIQRALAVLRRWTKPSDGYLLRLPFVPPLPVLWNRRAALSALSPAAFLHHTYHREAWLERTPWSRAKLLAKLVLVWPVANLAMTSWSTVLNGRAVKRRTGKGIARQVVEQSRVLAMHGIQAPWYYTFELFDDDRRSRAGDYIQRSETKNGAYLLMNRYLHAKGKGVLANKVKFDERCRQNGIRAIPVFAVAQEGKVRFTNGTQFPPGDIFLKPTNGRGGVGADWWRHQADGSYRRSGGEVLSSTEFTAHLARLSLAVAYIACPRVVNHPALADLTNGALSTLRIVTAQNERGAFEATDAVFRMAIGANSVIDNFHAGGLASNLHLETGELGPATDLGIRPDIGWCDRHPSGAPITGRKLPHWRDAIALVERAHAAFADQRVVIGWDVAILPDGACIVEGNGGADLDIHQRVSREPAGCTRLGELLAFQTRRALAARDEARRPA